MGKTIKIYWKLLKKEISSHKIIYLLLTLTLLGGLFIRTYRTDQILGFYYDQGRDAMEVWELWHEGDLMLIGPTTGIAGIFRGPFYFYLIAPFYLISGGNPVLPAYFLAFVSILAILLAYYLGMKIHSRTAGLLTAIIASFSFYMMVAGRWLSNPTPMLLLSMLLVWMLLLVNEGKKWAWIIIALVSGLSLFHFGSSGEFFYFPALVLFFLWQLWKNKSRGIGDRFEKTMGWKVFLLSGLAFLLTASLLIIYDFKYEHLWSTNIRKFFFEEESFKTNFNTVLLERMNYFYAVFTSKLFNSVKKI
jgi:hypothetical protein